MLAAVVSKLSAALLFEAAALVKGLVLASADVGASG
jgi:hypothetical protein